MFSGSNIHYEMAERMQGMGCGGIGAIHLMAQRIGLIDELNEKVQVLKRHLPYHESDHVLNIAYNIMAGGVRLEDIEQRRNDECFLNGLGAQRIPDPTTAGDFTRRFEPEDIVCLMEAVNQARKRVWKEQPQGLLSRAVIDVDGTVAETLGQCKAGMDISYKGIWGYAPLILSLANTKEVLYLINRPGNAVSHDGAGPWIDRAIELVKPHAEQVHLRGDTDFSLTGKFDEWDEGGVTFNFGMDAHPKLVALADSVPEAHWRRLARAQAEIKTEPRERPENVKEQIVRERGFINQRLESEQVAEFEYEPVKCRKSYRMIVLRKNLSIERGEKVLFDEIRYFFYITNRRDLAWDEVVQDANERCNQENVIEQLKNGVNAMRIPVNDLNSNWAYMVMAALAWNLKAWFGLMVPNREHGLQLVKMEFRSFLAAVLLVPAQVIRAGRKIIYRILSYNRWLKDFFATWERLRRLEAT
jgi:Transposase DDE domain group 1